MSQEPSKKRLLIYIGIFVAVAFLIVFFTQKKQGGSISNFDRSNNVAFEKRSAVPLESTEMNSVTGTSPETLDLSQPSISVKNSETGVVTTITKQQNDINNIEKKVIKNGDISMHVNSIEKAIRKIKTIALSHGGDEVSSDFSKTGMHKNGFIIIKVPVNQYDKAFEAIKRIAPLVTHESSHAQDVTAQFIDLESRIKNKKDHESRLRTFFARAEDVDELIQIERELARVRTEIEQMEGQLKHLTDQTQFSTIHVTLREDASIVVSDSWRPMQVVKDSFNTLVRKSTNLLNITIRFVITSLPFILLLGFIMWFLYFAAKQIFKNKNLE